MLDNASFTNSRFFSALSEPERTETPFVLGRGIMSVGGGLKSLSIDVSTAEIIEASAQPQIIVDFADDRSSYARLMTLSASAKIGGGVSSASARASMSKSFKTSNRSLSLIINKLVYNQEIFIRDPRLSAEAVTFFKKNGSLEFMMRYGDRVVHRITTGGILSLIYTFQFNSIEEKQNYKSNIQAKYASASGGIGFSEDIIKTASSTAISVMGISTGVKNAPAVFLPVGGNDLGTGNKTPSEMLSSEIMSYFNNFEEYVRELDSPSPVVIEDINYGSTNGAPVNLTTLPKSVLGIEERQDRIVSAMSLDDELDKVLANIEYLESTAISWNPGVTHESLSALKSSGTDLQARIDADIRQMQDFHLKPSSPPTRSDLPVLRPEWILRALNLVGEGYKPIAHASDVVRIALPAHFDNQPARLILHVDLKTIFNVVNRVDIVAVQEDGSIVALSEPVDPVEISKSSRLIIRDVYRLVPKDVVAFEARMSNQGGTLYAFFRVFM